MKLRDYPVGDLKLVYRVMHAQLATNIELMDSQLLHDLQTILQREAAAQGVPVTDHQQWDAWLNDRAWRAQSPGSAPAS